MKSEIEKCNLEFGKYLATITLQFIEENNLTQGFNEVDVRNAWYDIMGKAIANYTTAIQFKNETLFIALSSSVLREELSYGIDKILKNLNEELGEELIKKVVLR